MEFMLFWRHHKPVFESVEMRTAEVLVTMLNVSVAVAHKEHVSENSLLLQGFDKQHRVPQTQVVLYFALVGTLHDILRILGSKHFLDFKLVDILMVARNNEHVLSFYLLVVGQLSIVYQVELLHPGVLKHDVWEPGLEIYHA